MSYFILVRLQSQCYIKEGISYGIRRCTWKVYRGCFLKSAEWVIPLTNLALLLGNCPKTDGEHSVSLQIMRNDGPGLECFFPVQTVPTVSNCLVIDGSLLPLFSGNSAFPLTIRKKNQSLSYCYLSCCRRWRRCYTMLRMPYLKLKVITKLWISPIDLYHLNRQFCHRPSRYLFWWLTDALPRTHPANPRCCQFTPPLFSSTFASGFSFNVIQSLWTVTAVP